MPKPKLVHLREGMRLQGRYKLTEHLGSGSMAEVWAARDRASGDVVAVKVISELMALSDHARKRFEREMLAIGSVHHANVVALLGHGQVEDGRPFLVMEYCEGETLQQYMDGHGRLGVRGTLLLVTQVLDGLSAAHEAGIIHRDLKPANILLAFLPSGRRRVKILDFGVAHLRDYTGEEASEKLTSTGSILGSPRYMAYEVARGTGIDPRADVFSVGAIAYHALTGQPPFQGEGLGAILTQIFNHEIRPLRELRADLPDGLVPCVERALAHLPQDRHDSAAEMRAELEQIMSGL